MWILVVEDDSGLADVLERALTREGHVVELAGDGTTALWAAREYDVDLVLLDLMIPEPDGVAVVATLRQESNWVPVLILTARDAVRDRVRGLDAGADDYLTKPFSIAELLARVRALGRRAPVERPVVLSVDGLELDPAQHTVRRDGSPISLSPREFALLHELMRQPGVALSRSWLLDHVWDSSREGDSNVVDVYIRYLRDKIDRPFGVATIETVRGVGYRLTGSGPESGSG